MMALGRHSPPEPNGAIAGAVALGQASSRGQLAR